MITRYAQALPIMVEFMEKQDLPQEVEESWEMINCYLECEGIEEYSKEWEERNNDIR